MSKEFLEKVFEPFTRADNSMTQKNQGTGLGLSITHSVVEMMGGVIEVKSEPGKGSIFTVILQFSAEEAPEKEESGQEKKRPAASFEGFRALLAEDNELNREIAETFLEDFGIKAESVVNGQEAVEKAPEKTRRWLLRCGLYGYPDAGDERLPGSPRPSGSSYP